MRTVLQRPYVCANHELQTVWMSAPGTTQSDETAARQRAAIGMRQPSEDPLLQEALSRLARTLASRRRLLLLLIAVVGGLVARWPLTTAMIYLGLGALFGHLRWIALDAHWLARASEIAVIVSLFSAGLKPRLPLTSRSWHLPVAFATIGMAATAALVASAGVLWLGLPLGAAVLLGAILAPTDPVLAADVKVARTGDTDPVRLTLTGEAGMNDGTAFPVLMLGLLGLHTLGDGAT